MDISVIIPVYRTPEDLLRASLMSAVTIEGASVVLVVDSPGHRSERDASILAEKYSQVKLLTNECNKGVSFSRNKGLSVSNSEWVTFLDADDTVDPAVYENGVELAERYKLDAIVVGGINKVYGLEKGAFLCGKFDDLNTRNFLSILESVGMSSCSIIYRRSYLEKYQIRFSTELANNEDFLFFTTVVQNGANIALYNADGYIQCGHPESTTRRAPSASRYISCVKAAAMVMSVLRPSEMQPTLLGWYAKRIAWQMFQDTNLFNVLTRPQKSQYALNLGVAAKYYGEIFMPVLSLFGRMLMSILSIIPRLYLCSSYLIARPLWHLGTDRLLKHVCRGFFSTGAKRVLVVIDDINFQGGAHTSTLLMVNAIIKCGCVVDVLTGTNPVESVRRIIPQCRFYKMSIPRTGIRWAIRGCITRLKIGWYPLWSIDPFGRWRELANRYDTVASIGEPSFFRSFVASLQKPRKVMFIHTDYVTWRNIEHVHTRWDRWLYKKFDCIAVVGEPNARRFADFFPAIAPRTVAFKNLIFKSRSSKTKNHELNDKIKLITLARIEKGPKCPERYLKVAAKLRDVGCDFVWTIFGGGPLLETMRIEAERLGISNFLKFQGYDAAAKDKIVGADLFVLLSNYEGLPNVVYESMISGTPVVATDVGGISAQIEDGKTGWLVLNNENMIIKKLEFLIKNPMEIRMVRARLKDFSYDNEEIVSEYKKILNI